MYFRADFDDILINPMRVDLSRLDWVFRLVGDTQFEIGLAYPMENPPKVGDFVHISNGDVPLFTGYVLDIQEKSLTLSNARRSPEERIE